MKTRSFFSLILLALSIPAFADRGGVSGGGGGDDLHRAHLTFVDAAAFLVCPDNSTTACKECDKLLDDGYDIPQWKLDGMCGFKNADGL